MSIQHSTGDPVLLPSLRVLKVNCYKDNRELIVILEKTCIGEISQFFGSDVLIGDWFAIQAQNPADPTAPLAHDLAMVKGRISLQLSRGLIEYLHLSPEQIFTIIPMNHFKRENPPGNRSWCSYIARFHVYSKSIISHMPGRVRKFLDLDVDTPLQFDFDDFRIQTKIQGKCHLVIPKTKLNSSILRQKVIVRQVVVHRPQSSKSPIQQPIGKSCFFSTESIFSDTRERIFYFPLTANEHKTLRESFGNVFPGDLAHGIIENPRTQKQVTFLLPIQVYMRIFFLYPVTTACGFKPGDPATLRIQNIIPQRQVGEFSTSLPFDVIFSCYAYESPLTIPQHIVDLYGLKLHDLVRLHIGGRRFILKLDVKRRLIIAGENPLGLRPGEQRLESITISKVGKRGHRRRLQRLGKKHTALKTLFQKLIKEDLVLEIASVDEVEPFYSNGSTTGARPDFRVVLKDQTLAHVELKAFNTLAHIDLKHEEQFQKYTELGFPLILVTTTRSSDIHPNLLPYFSHVFALEQLEEMVRQSGRSDF